MNNNEIKNQKVEIPKGIALNDKDYINCLLSSLKELEKNYTVALTEASNEQLFNKYKQTFDTVAALQRETYEIMFQKGWYCLEKAETQKITKKLNMLTQEYQDLEINS